MTGARETLFLALFIALMAMFRPATWAEAPLSADAVEFFENKIRPVLAQDCYECHRTSGKKKGGLALDYRDALLAGGDSGKVIDVVNPKASLLLKSIRHDSDDLQMPKARAKLDSQVIADFEKWVAMGAPDPRTAPATDQQVSADTDWSAVMKRRKEWWSFRSIKKPDLTSLPGTASTHPVDRLVRARQAGPGLAPSARADNYTLLRRLSFALRGLPPSLTEIDSFVTDREPGAYERWVDSYLASPHFGERWARHWMDWVRYADSHGSEGDPMIPYAWRYRDYLIRALNADVPYNQLVREHLAGDLLGNPRINTTLGLNESALGLGHLRMVFHGFSPTDPLEEQVRFTDDQIGVVSKAFLGLTVSCARCHNHKFDPISQKDFYGWYGVFVSCPPAAIAVDAVTPESQALRANASSRRLAVKSVVGGLWHERAGEIAYALAKPSETTRAAIEAAKEPSSILYPFYTARHSTNQAGISPALTLWRERVRSLKDNPAKEIATRWNLTSPGDYQHWRHDGPGVASASPAGSFALAPEGDKVFIGIYPAGIYTHLQSTKDRGVLLSPRYTLDDKYDLWVRVLGDGSPVLRYVMQNYPRDGTVYPVERLGGNRWRWVKFGVDYWQGDKLHIEITTAADQPVLADINSTRSWFGVRDVLVTKAGSPAPSESFEFVEPILGSITSIEPKTETELAEIYSQAARTSLEAWLTQSEGRPGITDGQAMFLDQLLRAGLLPNRTNDLADAQSAVAAWRSAEAKLPIPTRAQGVMETDPYDQPLFVRGEHKQPAEAIPRRFLDAIDNTPFGTSQSGRREFAEAILASNNPLASRVIVNRVWHHLFGRGIVATTDNFGRLGQEPSNPELLDYLASWFVEHGYSIKALVRFIVTSETWQQASEPSALAAERDPNNLLLSHFSIRRLEAEAIRDELLSVSGDLREAEMYGPPINGRTPRRSVYLQVKRNDLDPFVSTFDAPAPASTKGVRDVTNIPGQSLALLNDPMVLELAGHWGLRLTAQGGGSTPADLIRIMFREALGRPPGDAELARSLEFLRWSAERRSQSQESREQIQRVATKARERLAEITSLANARGFAQRQAAPAPQPTTLVQPLIAWNFQEGLVDRQESVVGTLHNQARLENGALVVDGNASYMSSAPLKKTLKAKTLEAWVQLDTLKQGGGGVLTVQDLDGNIFDSIVFAEKQPLRWVAGSDLWNRTQSFDGSEETEAADQPVQVALTYAEDGTITAYRNGVPYGQPYKSKGPTTFEAGKAQVVMGNRHGEPGGNRSLSGRIYQARIYDRALTAAEVAASAAASRNFISTADRLAAMTAPERAEYEQLRSELAQADQSLQASQQAQGLPSEWADLGHALFNLKEFIYVR